MSILVVGSVAFDTIETPAGRADGVLGGSASYFSVAASFFAPVHLVAVVGQDFTEEHIRIFRDREIDTSGLSHLPGNTFHWSGVYGDDINQRTTLATELNVFREFKPVLPERLRRADYLFLANIDPDLQRSVLEQVKQPKLVACDTMNFWIEGKREALRETLKGVDVLLINDEEARQLALESNTVRAARKILGYGPRSLIIKRGEYGAALYNNHSYFAVPAYPLLDPVDPTGAGDSFAGGFMGHLARKGSLDDSSIRQALVVGSVMASFCVEDFSLRRFLSLRPEQIRTRLKEFGRMTQYTDPT
ncbi:MAG: sugar kinase [Acidobacteria bacterium]|nr:MAG: sugar kinase [Acidobacteriota bacterium]